MSVVPVAVLALVGGIAACSDDAAESEITRGSSLPESVAPTSTGAIETVPGTAPSDSTTTVEPVSSGSDAVFDFATDELCDRISGQRVAEIVEAAFRAHDATPVPSGFDDEGSNEDPAYRYCGWDFEGGAVGLVETEPAEEARSKWSFVTHPALSPGVMVSEEGLGYIGESGEFIDGLEVRLLVEGHDSTVEFWHTAPVGYSGDESALLAVADGLLHEMGWVPTGAVDVFSFAEHDLCEWMSTDALAEFIAAEFDWSATVEIRTPQVEPGESCEWVLRGEASELDGSIYLVQSVAGAYGSSVDYGEEAELGVWVVGHPGLDEPALTATAGFGGVAYGFPDEDRIITMWLQVPGYEEPDADFSMAEAAVANQILHELGWFTPDSD